MKSLSTPNFNSYDQGPFPTWISTPLLAQLLLFGRHIVAGRQDKGPPQPWDLHKGFIVWLTAFVAEYCVYIVIYIYTHYIIYMYIYTKHMYPTMNVCSVSSGLPQCYGMFLSRFDHPGDVVRAALKMDPWLVKPMRSEEHTHDMAIIGTMMMNQIYKAQICWNATIHHLIYNSSTGRLWHFSNVQHIIPKN